MKLAIKETQDKCIHPMDQRADIHNTNKTYCLKCSKTL